MLQYTNPILLRASPKWASRDIIRYVSTTRAFRELLKQAESDRALAAECARLMREGVPFAEVLDLGFDYRGNRTI